MKDIHVLLKDKDYFIFKFHKLGIYSPDGTGKEYKLEKPVHAIYLKDRKMLVIDAYPALTSTLKGDITGSTTFPAGTSPVLISDIAKAEMSGGNNLGRLRVAYDYACRRQLPLRHLCHELEFINELSRLLQSLESSRALAFFPSQFIKI